MCKSIRAYINALGYWGLLVVAPITLDVIGSLQLALGNQFTGIPSWVWFNFAFLLLLIIPFIAFHKIRIRLGEVTQDRANVLARLILQVTTTASHVVSNYNITKQQDNTFKRVYDEYRHAVDSLITESKVIGGNVDTIVNDEFLAFVLFHVTRLCDGFGPIISDKETKRKMEIDEFQFIGSMAGRADNVIKKIKQELTR